MKSTFIVGIVLIALGVVGLGAGYISYTTKEHVLDIGPIHATADKEHVIGIPEAAAIAALIAGVVLCIGGTRRG